MEETDRLRRQTTLDKILTTAQMLDLQKLLKQMDGEGLHPYQPIFTARLKELFRQWRAELEAKEIDPDYLAYAVLHGITTQRRK